MTLRISQITEQDFLQSVWWSNFRDLGEVEQVRKEALSKTFSWNKTVKCLMICWNKLSQINSVRLTWSNNRNQSVFQFAIWWDAMRLAYYPHKRKGSFRNVAFIAVAITIQNHGTGILSQDESNKDLGTNLTFVSTRCWRMKLFIILFNVILLSWLRVKVQVRLH